MTVRRLIVGITGASGAVYGIRLLRVLAQVADIETHLVISKAGHITITHETDYSVSDVHALADKSYNINDIAACMASGSYKTLGMVVAPCSMHTLAEVAHGLASNLLTRAADVVLKEGRPLILLARETPLHAIHLENMLKVTQAGGVIMPPLPAFYQHPKTIEDIVDHTVARILDRLGIDNDLSKEWTGLSDFSATN